MSEKKHGVCPVSRAGHLDNFFRKLLQNPNKILSPHVQPGMSVLDVGCGPGFFTLEAARLVGDSGRVTAADLQTGMLDKVKAKIQGTNIESRVTLHQCRKDGIGVRDPFDFILAFYVVHEVPEADAFFRETASILNAGGSLFMVEPSFHVSGKAFDECIEKAGQAGFTLHDKPKVFFSKTALLKKDAA